MCIRDRNLTSAVLRRIRGTSPDQSGAWRALSRQQAPSHNRANEKLNGCPLLSHAGGEEVPMSDKIYDVPPAWQKRAYADKAKYEEMYARSIKDPNGFWAEQAKRIDWIKPFKKVKNSSFAVSYTHLRAHETVL